MAFNRNQINTLNTRQYASDDPLKIVTSTNIDIEINGRKIGLIQSFSRNEGRDVTPVSEIGTEGLVQLVPNNYQGGTLSVDHFRIYGRLMFETLGLYDLGAPQSFIANFNPIAHLAQQRLPFSVKVTVRGAAKEDPSIINRRIVEVYHGCWLTSYSYDVSSGNITVSEKAEIKYTWPEIINDEETFKDPGLQGIFLTKFQQSESLIDEQFAIPQDAGNETNLSTGIIGFNG